MLSTAIIKFIVCFSIFSGMAAMKMENSLTGPFDVLGQNSPFWDLSGSAQLTNSYIRLTTDEHEKKGSLWNNFPCLFNNWEMQTHFRIHGKGVNLNGDGLAIWYARDPLQTGSVFGSKDYFSGLGIFIDTYKNQKEQNEPLFPYISAMVNNGSFHYANEEDGVMTQIGGCHANIRNTEVPTRIAVSYINNNLGVYLDIEGTGQWRVCFTSFGVFLPTGYFLGLSASTSEYSDNHDIISVTTMNLDTPDTQWEDRSNVMPLAFNLQIPEKYHKDFIEKNQIHEEVHVEKRKVQEDVSAEKESHEKDKSSEEDNEETKSAEKYHHVKTEEKHHHVKKEEEKHHDEIKKDHHVKKEEEKHRDEIKKDHHVKTEEKKHHDEINKDHHDEAKEAHKKHFDQAKVADKDEKVHLPSLSWFKMFIYITGGGILIMVAISMYRKYSERRREIMHKRLF